jgi:hypothetical protein
MAFRELETPNPIAVATLGAKGPAKPAARKVAGRGRAVGAKKSFPVTAPPPTVPVTTPVRTTLDGIFAQTETARPTAEARDKKFVPVKPAPAVSMAAVIGGGAIGMFNSPES